MTTPTPTPATQSPRSPAEELRAAARNLRTDGPHNPDYTREVGNVLAEAVRVLNYATLAEAPGLDGPADAYSLLGALYTATMRLPQLLTQLARFLDDWRASGQLADDHQREPAGQVRSALTHLQYAEDAAADLTSRLRETQNAIAGLYVTEVRDA